jgi:hypothetical protein
MNQGEKLIVVRNFLDKIKMPGVCDFVVLASDDVQVIINIDLEWMQRTSGRPDLIAKGMRSWLKNKIDDYLGMDLYVGSTGVEKCN